MPPLWKYFSRQADRQTSPLLPPKGVDPRTLAAVRLEAKGLPPLGQYFSRLGNQTPFTLLDRPDLKAEPRF